MLLDIIGLIIELSLWWRCYVTFALVLVLCFLLDLIVGGMPTPITITLLLSSVIPAIIWQNKSNKKKSNS